jgi:hypothetical protein
MKNNKLMARKEEKLLQNRNKNQKSKVELQTKDKQIHFQTDTFSSQPTISFLGDVELRQKKKFFVKVRSKFFEKQNSLLLVSSECCCCCCGI